MGAFLLIIRSSMFPATKFTVEISGWTFWSVGGGVECLEMSPIIIRVVSHWTELGIEFPILNSQFSISFSVKPPLIATVLGRRCLIIDKFATKN